MQFYFCINEVLKQELDLKVDAVRAKRSKYLPTVLTKEEVLAIINNLSAVYQLVVKFCGGDTREVKASQEKD